MGIRYVAWSGDQCVSSSLSLLDKYSPMCCRKYTGDNLPAYSQMATHEDFALDAQAVARTIAEDVDQRTAD